MGPRVRQPKKVDIPARSARPAEPRQEGVIAPAQQRELPRPLGDGLLQVRQHGAGQRPGADLPVRFRGVVVGVELGPVCQGAELEEVLGGDVLCGRGGVVDAGDVSRSKMSYAAA